VLIMAEILLTRTKQYAWLAMLRWNAILIIQICGSIWHHSYGAMIYAMNEWWIVQTNCFVFHTHTKARTMLAVFSASAVSLYDAMNTNIISSCCESHFISILPFKLTTVISHTYIQQLQVLHGNPSK